MSLSSAMRTLASSRYRGIGRTQSLTQGVCTLAVHTVTKGIIVLDTSVRAPTASSYLTGKTNASNTDGYAAGVGEDAKVKHHTGTLTSSWAFVPFVQESYGRLGKQTSLFVKELAMHSALCSGGGKADVLRKAGLAKRQILIELSISLVRELAERVMAYTRGARMLGCVAAPVSKLLGHSAD